MTYTNSPTEITIDKQQAIIQYKILNDHPLHRINIPSCRIPPGTSNELIPKANISIKYHNEPEITEQIILHDNSESSKIIDFINSKISNRSKFIQIEVENIHSDHFFLRFEFHTGAKFIDVSSPEKDFFDHFNNPINSKILFSAPFGHGKTTFLNYFFEKNESRYEVFRVFPVNYSVSNNNDIFRYIKADILYQLLGKDVGFEFSEITNKQAFEEYVYLNPLKTIGLLVKTIFSLNKTTEKLPSVINQFEEFFNQVQEYKKNQGKDDKSKAKDYIEQLYENEGSIFEDNFYTQLIRQLLEQLIQNKTKQNVLIIEDLDRMDPDHIFRILNVISAHYDAYHLRPELQYNNKFGFDKIILVCDYNNIKKIFEHRYGAETDFNGYFNKYFSSKPFTYNNEQSINSFINEVFKQINQRNYNHPNNEALIFILNQLISEHLLSLREVLKLLNHNFNHFNTDQESSGNRYFLNRGKFTKAYEFLLNLYSSDVLIQKLDIARNRIDFPDLKFHESGKNLLASLGTQSKDSKTTFFKNYSFHFEAQEYFDYHLFSEVTINKVTNSNGIEVSSLQEFTNKDFYDLSIEVVKRIKNSQKNH